MQKMFLLIMRLGNGNSINNLNSFKLEQQWLNVDPAPLQQE